MGEELFERPLLKILDKENREYPRLVGEALRSEENHLN